MFFGVVLFLGCGCFGVCGVVWCVRRALVCMCAVMCLACCDVYGVLLCVWRAVMCMACCGVYVCCDVYGVL